jgi:mannitol-1-/sugar-/sorbitol-6-phosphatase
MHCDSLLFDLDGVLVDSIRSIERHWTLWAARHGIDMDVLRRVAHGRRTVEIMRLVAPHLDVESEALALAAGEAGDTEGVLEVAEARRLISEIPEGAWAVATSGSRAIALARLRHTRLPVPRVLVTADDVQRGKPHPEPYLLAAERLGVAPERCVVVEDAPAGIDAARAAGMAVIAVASTHDVAVLSHAHLVVPELAGLRVVPATGGWRLRVLSNGHF